MGAAVLRCADVLGGDIMQRAMNAVPVGAKSERGTEKGERTIEGRLLRIMYALVVSSVLLLDSLELFQNRWLGRCRVFTLTVHCLLLACYQFPLE